MLDVPSMEGLGLGTIAPSLRRNVNVLLFPGAFALSIGPVASVAIAAAKNLTGISCAAIAACVTRCIAAGVDNAALRMHGRAWVVVIAAMGDTTAVGSLMEDGQASKNTVTLDRSVSEFGAASAARMLPVRAAEAFVGRDIALIETNGGENGTTHLSEA